MSRLGWLIDYVWPPRSLLTDVAVSEPGRIEADAWSSLRFLTEPWCARCGFPFETSDAPGLICGVCLADPPPFAAARAPLVYDEGSRKLVLDLKRGGRRDGLTLFARWMARAGADCLTPGAVLVPVPLHWTRLAERRFNQAAWLAEALSAETGVPVRRTLLVRRARRKSQGEMSASARRRNVAGVFAVPEARKAELSGQSVVLVDDVFTTGATVTSATKTLMKAGAAQVVVLTLARVVRVTDVS